MAHAMEPTNGLAQTTTSVKEETGDTHRDPFQVKQPFFRFRDAGSPLNCDERKVCTFSVTDTVTGTGRCLLGTKASNSYRYDL